MHPVRKLLSKITTHRIGAGPIKDMPDEALLDEYNHWDKQITSATGWGAALAAASEFRKEAKRELIRRNLPIPTTQPETYNAK